jgi:hypothetical protein
MTNTKTIEIKTAHFEGSHTSYDWQSYEVEIIQQTAKSIVVRCARLIEGRKRINAATETPEFRLRTDQVRGL